MRTLTRSVLLTASLALPGCHDLGKGAGTVGGPPPEVVHVDPRLTPALDLPTNCNGVATSSGHTVYLNFPHADGGVGVKVATMTDGRDLRPFPDLRWNSFNPGTGTDDAAGKFVGTNSLRFGPDGHLWVVDTGTTSPGGKPVPGGAKLVAFDLTSGALVRSIPLDAVVRPDSFVDDVRFNGTHAYLTDAGHPAIIVLDLATGQARRVLEDDASTTGSRPMRAVGHALTKFDGTPAKLNADQLEVSPDGRTFYFQPCVGPMSKIATRYLDDPAVPAADVARHVEPFADTPTSGGTCMDADGVIYLNDADRSRVLRLTPDGHRTTLIEDDRLHWADAMWIDDAGDLWVPAAQMDRTATFNGGIPAVELPVHVYRVPLGLRPLRN